MHKIGQCKKFLKDSGAIPIGINVQLTKIALDFLGEDFSFIYSSTIYMFAYQIIFKRFNLYRHE